MRLLTAVFGSAEEFLAAYSSAFPSGSLFCATKALFSLNEPIVVEVSFPELSHPVLLRGRVISLVEHRGTWLGIDRVDRRSGQFLLAVARGGGDRQDRHHRRFPASLPVSCQIDEVEAASVRPRSGHINDLGYGGAFVAAPDPPSVGTRVSLTIGPTGPTGNLVQVDGRVAWVGAEESRLGFGVCFDNLGVHGAGRLRHMLRLAAHTGRSQALGL